MKKFLISACVIGLIAGLSSCNKWLDLKPQDGIVGDEFWNTKEQVDAAVTGIYSSMQASTSGDRALPEYFFLWGEARTDMVSPGFRADQDEQDMVNLNMLPTNKFVNWRSFYQTINYCNTIIELAPAVLQKDPTFSQTRLDQAIGQALSVRALMYFYLVRSFRDVPLKLNATISDQNIISIPKSSADTVLNQIVTDLRQAEPLVPLTFGNPTIDKGRVSRYAVNAMLADVYLWMDKYTECVAECDKVISSGRYGLVTAGDFYNSIFLNGNSNEGIFELQYDVQRLNPFYGMHTLGNRRWGAAQHLTDEVYGVDVTNSPALIDFRGENAAYRANDFSIWKYVGADRSGDQFRAADQSTANWIFYRYADILLMKAEAINQMDQPLEASRIVKRVRERGVPQLGFQQGVTDIKSMDSTSKSGMSQFILDERQREFAFEGKRWYDVLRNAKRNNYAQINLLLNMAAISISGDRRQAAFNKLKDKNSHYFPIYFYEIQTNKLLEQNPFYK